ncbi:MAG TPA: class I SAM-dependent methyltransferase [Gemmatimonadaceae bacterium]
MAAVIETTMRSAVGRAAIPSPLALGAPTPAMNQTVAPGAATAPVPSLRCPRCRRTLVPVREGHLQCTRPARPHTYPIIAGIPDLRATPDADIAVARERADAKFLAEMLSRVPQDTEGRSDETSLLMPEASFAEANAATPVLCSPDEVLSDWQGLDQDSPEPRVVLDIGCGSGALLEEAARRWPVCVGVDSSLRRLVLARHRLQQAGIRARLVCANVDALPFDDGLFDRVIAEWILERSPRKERALREWNRMLGVNGRLWITTSNRWSVSRDPQLGIPALSWLPMQLLDFWARWHGLTFPQRALVGTKRLRRLLEETGFARVRLGDVDATGSQARPATPRRPTAVGRRTLYDMALVREIVKRVRPMLVATAGASPRLPSRAAYDRYVARLAL